MLDHKGFDLWADGYDRAVGVSDEENSYPFAGYKRVLGRIYAEVMEKPKARTCTRAISQKGWQRRCCGKPTISSWRPTRSTT